MDGRGPTRIPVTLRRVGITLALVLVTATTPPLDGSRALAQDASASPSVAPSAMPVDMGTFRADLGDFGVPADEVLPGLAAAEVSDAPVPRDDATFDQVAARAGAIVDATDVTLTDLGQLAARLDYTPLAAFELVRDSIGYDPYPGTLRGALGTLHARAGNDLDRALLLQALLDRMSVDTQLVSGTLDAATAAQVLERSLLPATSQLPSVPIDSQELGDLDALLARAGRDYASIRAALGDRIDTMTTGADERGSLPHVWVRMRFGTQWLDLDPTLPDAQPGDTLTAMAEVVSRIPDEWRHRVRVRVFGETLDAGTLTERTLLDQELDAATAASTDVHLAFQPVSTSLGETLAEALGAGAGWRPVLFVGEEPRMGDPFPVTREQDILSGEESGAEVSRLRTEITVTSPGEAPRVTERTILDRLTEVARDGQPVPNDVLAPLTERDGVPVELSSVQHIQVSTGGFDAREHQVWRRIGALFAKLLVADPELAGEYGFPTAVLPMTVADETLVLTSERLVRDGLDSTPGTRVFVGHPRVFVTSVSPGTDEGRYSTAVDLLDDTIDVVTAPGASATQAARLRLWYGALQGALESRFLLTRIGAGSLEDGTIGGVGFGLTDQPRLVATAAELAADAAPDLRADLDAGRLAVVPVGDGPARAWWSVDPRTGETRALLSGGGSPATGGSNYVNGSRGGIFEVDPNSVPRTQQELNQLYRQAVRQQEAMARARPTPQCVVRGQEYSALVCVAILAAVGFFVLGAVVLVVYWII